MEPDVATGETSRKKTNQDDTERPLKKAKYLWQVKGKYHLKDNQTSNNYNNNNNIAEKTIDEQKNDAPSNKTQSSCIEALIANSDKYMEFSLLDKNIDKSISDEIPITLVKQSPQTDDFYLRKWQARQIAKGFLDNTINRVLEHWMVAPFDAADLVENCDSGGQVEDEGILMAIQSHGLQSGVRPSLFHCNTRLANWEAQHNCTCASKTTTTTIEVGHATSFMPFHQRDQSDLNDFCYYEDKPPPLSPLTTTTTTTTTSKIKVETVEMPMLIDDDDNDDDGGVDVDGSLKMNDTDFLDAAVAVAIQKKGLTSLNCVDCG